MLLPLVRRTRVEELEKERDAALVRVSALEDQNERLVSRCLELVKQAGAAVPVFADDDGTPAPSVEQSDRAAFSAGQSSDGP